MLLRKVLSHNKSSSSDSRDIPNILDTSSSREHAPIAIKAAGVSCVIAETFARIFYRNAINIGLPIIECAEASRDIEDGDQVDIDFDSGIITNVTKGKQYRGQAFPEFMQKLISAGGLQGEAHNLRFGLMANAAFI